VARDYLDIVSRVEGHYPQAVGGSNADEVLRRQLVGFYNDVTAEIDRQQRWSLSYNEGLTTTTPGTQSYVISNQVSSSDFNVPTFVKRVYYLDSTGRIKMLERYEREELQRLFGDVTGTANEGAPRYYCLEPLMSGVGGSVSQQKMQLLLYPCPDGNGPSSGNYNIVIGGYWPLAPIVETSGTISSTSTSLTVPSVAALYSEYLSNLPLNGSSSDEYLTVRGAGSPIIGGSSPLSNNLVTSWTSMSGTTVTLSSAAGTSVTNAQVFFRSVNWMITHWPKVILFGMLREVASYYGKQDAYQAWEQRFQDQLERMRQYEYDRQFSYDPLVVAQPGQNASAFKRQDAFNTFDVRGDTGV